MLADDPMMPYQFTLMALEVIESAQRMANIAAGLAPALPHGPPVPFQMPPRKRCPYCNGKQTDRDTCPGCGAPR